MYASDTKENTRGQLFFIAIQSNKYFSYTRIGTLFCGMIYKSRMKERLEKLSKMKCAGINFN